MTVPTNLKYTDTHEWIRDEGNNIFAVGITDHAQTLLGDMVFVDAPAIGRQVNAKAQITVVESVKAASDMYAPISGVVTEVNDILEGSPELVNQQPYDTWIFKIKASNPAELDALLSPASYTSMIDEE